MPSFDIFLARRNIPWYDGLHKVAVSMRCMANVVIYTTPSCVYCRMAKAFFGEHNIQFTEKNVMTDVEAQEEMIRKSGQLGVPVIDVDGQIVIGFDKPRLSSLLNIK